MPFHGGPLWGRFLRGDRVAMRDLVTAATPPGRESLQSPALTRALRLLLRD